MSPKRFPSAEVLIVGASPESSWTAMLLGFALARQGCVAPVVLVGNHEKRRGISPADRIVITVGNGEMVEKAFLVYGDATASRLWEISRRNHDLARDWCSELQVACAPSSAVWLASDDRARALVEASVKRGYGGWLCESSGPVAGWEWVTERFAAALVEPALAISSGVLERQLERRLGAEGVCVLHADRLIGIEKKGARPFDYGLTFAKGSNRISGATSVLLYVGDCWDPTLFPSLNGKGITVTLSSFSFPKREQRDFSQALFNGGADFAVSENDRWRVGSFRNLYQDKAVGVHYHTDPDTWNGVTRFFGQLGWIDPRASFESHLSLESVSCDGLPLVGAFSDLPGVYFTGAFAARTQNFIFEVANRLALGIVKGEGFEALSLFSTRRFV